ncbi:MAG: hypothetical protein Unbinned3987contig1001_10 [Prokaryotic dsDNA virus sp.]|jgi:hypothetical protein|nr:MAG: hypothetical protein Unbinned3987contig1001_10 [Prokaryotic dsDNA virus sp.]|tara:strand:- start:255 stop:434 length:180 start_codon:yes stop_codon:yes gene_type:complete
MELLKKITSSKKFWYAVGTIFLLFFSDKIGISDQAVNNVVLIAIALLISQGLADKSCKK